MTTQVYQLSGGGTYGVFPKPIIAPRNPTTSDTVDPSGAPYQILQGWNNNTNDNTYLYLGGGVWVEITSLAGTVTSLSSTNGTNVTPTNGNIQLAGTTNQITVTAGSSVLTFSVPSTFIAPGSIAATTTVTGGTGITATTGPLTATNGNLVLGTAGNKIVSTSVATTTTAGANSFGSVALVGGTATVSTTAVTANSLIVTWRQSIGATGAGDLGLLTLGTITAGTSFVINAVEIANATVLQASDLSVVGWVIIN